MTEAQLTASYVIKKLTINGVQRRVMGKPNVTLLTVLRKQLKMTRTKRSCNCGQCGFCTPDFITLGKALLDQNPMREEAREWFCKNWMACCCTGYKHIVDAVMRAAAILRSEEKNEDLAKMYKQGDKVWNSSYPRPNTIIRRGAERVNSFL